MPREGHHPVFAAVHRTGRAGAEDDKIRIQVEPVDLGAPQQSLLWPAILVDCGKDEPRALGALRVEDGVCREMDDAIAVQPAREHRLAVGGETDGGEPLLGWEESEDLLRLEARIGETYKPGETPWLQPGRRVARSWVLGREYRVGYDGDLPGRLISGGHPAAEESERARRREVDDLMIGDEGCRGIPGRGEGRERQETESPVRHDDQSLSSQLPLYRSQQHLAKTG